LAFVAKFVYDQFINTKVDLAKYGAGKGSWALITGASDGIGKGYAEELARAGFNLIIVSRTQSKLQDLANKIKEEFKVQVSSVAIDLAILMSILPCFKSTKHCKENKSLSWSTTWVLTLSTLSCSMR